jgi:uncharacterized protein (DUF4415 family)
LEALDAYVLQPQDYEEIPEMTDEDFARGVIHVGGRPVGRPRAENAKKPVSLRLSPSVLEHFRATGPGWQTRINAVLEKEVARQRKKALQSS